MAVDIVICLGRKSMSIAFPKTSINEILRMNDDTFLNINS